MPTGGIVIAPYHDICHFASLPSLQDFTHRVAKIVALIIVRILVPGLGTLIGLVQLAVCLVATVPTIVTFVAVFASRY